MFNWTKKIKRKKNPRNGDITGNEYIEVWYIKNNRPVLIKINVLLHEEYDRDHCVHYGVSEVYPDCESCYNEIIRRNKEAIKDAENIINECKRGTIC
jgi:hypothetical protein